MIDWFDDARVVIGVLSGFFGLMSVIILWFDKRQKRFAGEAVLSASGQTNKLEVKVDRLEDDIEGLASDLAGIKRSFGSLDDRVHNVERSLETVARASDLADLNAEVKQLSGTVTAELRALFGMMHSFRESALRAAMDGNGK